MVKVGGALCVGGLVYLGVSYLNLEHLPEVHASVIYIFQTIEGYRASAFLLIMQGIVVILPAGETFTVALDNVQVARDVAHVILDDEVAVAAFYHKSSGANTHTIVTNGSELNHCTYLNVVRDKLFTVAVDKLIAPRVMVLGVSIA